MPRWEPGAAERLQQAALDLFTTRGFEQTTAAEIARAAGLTQRTFFRYFGDKRDVLFHGQDQFVQAFMSGIDAAPTDAPAMELVASALASAAALFPNARRSYALMRQTVIDENPALRERERHKLADLAGEMAGALRARGVREPAATLAAESGASVFGVAFTQWIHERQRRSLAGIVASVLDELAALNAARAQPRTSQRDLLATD